MYRIVVTVILATLSHFVLADVHNHDTVTMKNNHIIIGEIKIMEDAVLIIETDYSDSDFKVEWSQVKSIQTDTKFIVSLSNNDRFVGTLQSDKHNPDYVILYPEDGSKMFAQKADIVYLKGLQSGFWDRIAANVDGGISVTKASNTLQISLSGQISYLYSRLGCDIYGNWINNIVQDTIRTDRANFGTNGRIFLKNNYLFVANADFLSSDEQDLKLRTTLKLGMGRFLVRNDKVYFMSSVGLASNNESYKTECKETSQTVEGFLDLEFKAFDVKDFRFLTRFEYYANLSEQGRQRINTTVDLKWDLPKDFYIGANLTLNYDSRPVETASKVDYFIQNKIGWSF